MFLRRLSLALCLASAIAPCWSVQGFAPDAYTFSEDPIEGDSDISLRLDAGRAWSRADRARIVFCHRDADSHLFLEATREGLRLGKVAGSVSTELGAWTGWPQVAEGAGYDITIKRRAWAITVLVGAQVAIRAHDTFCPGAAVGWAQRSVRVSDVRLQPIGDMFLEDGFARPPDEDCPWLALSGSWETSLPEARNHKAVPTKSANPFTFKVETEPGAEALATEGWRFWDSYQVRAAVRAGAPGQVGIAGYVQENGDCYVLRAAAAETAEDAGQAELVLRRSGAETVLSAANLALPLHRWHELRLRVFEGRIEGLVNGELLCEAVDNTFGQGRAGLYARDCARAYFDDVRLAPYARFCDDFSGAAGLTLKPGAGDWAVQDGALRGSVPAGGGPATVTTGAPDWTNYALGVDIDPGKAGEVQMLFGSTEAAGYAIRWTPGDGKMELVRRTEQGQEVLDSRTVESGAGTHRIEAVIDRGYIGVSRDGARVLEAVEAGATAAGRVGLLVDGPRGADATFDNLDVRFLDPPKQPVSITEQFAQENTMANWARPAASWSRTGRNGYAYTLPVWGDFVIRTTLPPTAEIPRAWSIAVALSPQQGDETPPAMMLSGERASADGAVTCGEAKTAVTLDEAGTAVQIERRGGCLMARLEGQIVAWTRVPDGLAAPRVSLALSGGSISPDGITLTSPNILDEAFSSAPVEWDPAAGTWDISDRWHCSPQWSWFSGRDTQTPLLWLRRPVGGDIVVEYWGAMMMDLTEAPHYSHPSDLNTVICGDGSELCSGYALVFAGDNNKVGRIIRRGETVAQTSAFTFTNPVGANSGFHNVWFHSRVERTGGHIKYVVDGRPALEYDDPDPLPDGRVGIWSHQGNGILIARARIAFQR